MDSNDEGNDHEQYTLPPGRATESYTTPHQEPHEEAPEKSTARKKRDYSKVRFWGFGVLEVLQAVFNLILVITAIVGAVVVLRQLNLMDQQMADARKAADAQDEVNRRTLAAIEKQARETESLAKSSRSNERARVFIQNVILSSTGMVPNAGERLRAVIEIANSGRSAATHVSANVVFEILATASYPPESKEPFTGDYTVPPNVGGIAVEMTLELKQRGKNLGPLSQDVVDAIMSGRAAAFIHGRVKYSDIFDDRGWLDVCRVWRPDEVNGLTGGRGGWRDCTKDEQADGGKPTTP